MVNKSYGFYVVNKTNIILKFTAVILIIALLMFILFRIFNKEDNWIKDSKGLWIKHGNPAFIPENVLKQQKAISCASELYAAKSMGGINFSSQCLGNCGDYFIDIVNVPRTKADDLRENQCIDFFDNPLKYFIELNSQGQIVKIVD